MNSNTLVSRNYFSVGYDPNRIKINDNRFLSLIDALHAKYHFRVEPIRVEHETILVTIIRMVPGATKGLKDELLKMALKSGFEEAEVFVSVFSDPDYWE